MKLKLAIIFLALVLICSQLILWPKAASAAQPSVKLSSVKGEVLIKTGGGLREFTAVDGAELVQGDWVRTGKNSTAKLAYEDGTEATLGSSSYLNIQQLTSRDTVGVTARSQARITSWQDGHQSSLQLWAGSIWSKVKSLVNIDDKYEVETPTAVMGVRGTLYLVSVDPENGSTQSDVIDGTVGVAQNNEGAQAAPIQFVTMGKTLRLVSLTEPLPDQQAIDPQELIKNTQPEILTHLINDITERTQELADKTKDQQQTFDQTGNLEDIKAAIGTSSKLVELVKFGKEFMSTLQTSDKLEAVKQVLQDNQQSLEQVQTIIDTITTETGVIRSEVVETAKNAGVSQEQIDSLEKEAIGAPATPASTPEPTPTPTPISAPITSGGGHNDSGDASNTTPPLGTPVVTSITIDGGVSSLTIPDSGVTTFAALTATVKDQAGRVMPEERVSWSLSLSSPIAGVNVDASTGVITVASSTTPGSITLVATSSSNWLVTTTSAIALNAYYAAEVPAAAQSAVNYVDNGNNTATITLEVKNSRGVGIEGLTANDFTVKLPLRGQSYVVGQTPTFQNFLDQGSGVYEVTFAPGFGINETVDVEVKNVTIATLPVVITDTSANNSVDISGSFTDENFKQAVWEWLGNYETPLAAFTRQDLIDRMEWQGNSLFIYNCNISRLDGLENFQGTGLTTLYCDNNQLSSLPTLPTSLTDLSCSSNQLSSLPPLPTSLMWLDCSVNQLSSLPPLPTSLSWLDCSINQLSSLASLPNGLTWLECSVNQLSSLPPLPTSLTWLDCYSNQLSSLPILPNGLTWLHCYSNELSSLPILPTTLTDLMCAYNHLNVFEGTLKSTLDACTADHKKFTPQYRYSYTGVPITLETDFAHTLLGNELSWQQSDDGTNWRKVADGVVSKFTFASSVDAVATVDSLGIITAHDQGSCNIYGYYGNVFSDFTKVIIPVVSCVPVANFAFTTSSDTSATFTWTAVEGATEIKIEKALTESNTWDNATTGTIALDAATATVTGLTASTGYDFRLVVTGGINAGNSNTLVDVRTEVASTTDISNSFTDRNFKQVVWEWLGNSTTPPGIFTRQDLNDRMASQDYSLNIAERNVSSLAGLENFQGTGLTTLVCSYNQLSSLPTLPSSLTTLNCDGNQLSSLPTLPSGLTALTCKGNRLSSLPTLPADLTSLYCYSNQLSSLPTLPSRLTTLDCSGNDLSTLPTLPIGLRHLMCANNYLDVFDGALKNELDNLNNIDEKYSTPQYSYTYTGDDLSLWTTSTHTLTGTELRQQKSNDGVIWSVGGDGVISEFTFSSSNVTVATVDSSGIITALAPGSCSIYVKYGNDDSGFTTVIIPVESYIARN